jgi:hypothetical protein
MRVERALKISLGPSFCLYMLKGGLEERTIQRTMFYLAQNYLNLSFNNFLFLKDQLAKAHTT